MRVKYLNTMRFLYVPDITERSTQETSKFVWDFKIDIPLSGIIVSCYSFVPKFPRILLYPQDIEPRFDNGSNFSKPNLSWVFSWHVRAGFGLCMNIVGLILGCPQNIAYRFPLMTWTVLNHALNKKHGWLSTMAASVVDRSRSMIRSKTKGNSIL